MGSNYLLYPVAEYGLAICFLPGKLFCESGILLICTHQEIVLKITRI